MTFWQYLLPKHLLSIGIHRVMQIQTPWFKNTLIKWFIKQFKVDLSLANRSQISEYLSFNDFFTRALKPEVRKIAAHGLVCPVDGKVSQLGNIHSGYVLSAKAQPYSVLQLLGQQDKADYYTHGSCITVYLSPKDYHRIHMPCDGQLKSMTYIPGTLFSVNQQSTQNIPALLARNERVICYFDTPYAEMAFVLVGAVFVGSMQTIWHGKITPPYGKKIKHWHYDSVDIRLSKGEELGRFNMGSTILQLLPKQVEDLYTNTKLGDLVQMGQGL